MSTLLNAPLNIRLMTASGQASYQICVRVILLYICTVKKWSFALPPQPTAKEGRSWESFRICLEARDRERLVLLPGLPHRGRHRPARRLAGGRRTHRCIGLMPTGWLGAICRQRRGRAEEGKSAAAYNAGATAPRRIGIGYQLRELTDPVAWIVLPL